MTRYVVILPAGPTDLAVGEEFSADRWPPHVTLVPAFSSGASQDVIIDRIEAGLAGVTAPEVVFRGIEPFVERDGVKVNFVTAGDELAGIHNALLAALKQIGDLALDNPEHHGASYVPHAKALASADVPVGVSLRPARILVAALPTPGGNPGRQIISEVFLKA